MLEMCMYTHVTSVKYIIFKNDKNHNKKKKKKVYKNKCNIQKYIFIFSLILLD